MRLLPALLVSATLAAPTPEDGGALEAQHLQTAAEANMRQADAVIDQVQADIKDWSFKVKSGEAEKPMIVVDFHGEQKEFSAEEISSMILVKMKEIAEVGGSCYSC